MSDAELYNLMAAPCLAIHPELSNPTCRQRHRSFSYYLTAHPGSTCLRLISLSTPLPTSACHMMGGAQPDPVGCCLVIIVSRTALTSCMLGLACDGG